jgi:hypothetical protein
VPSGESEAGELEVDGSGAGKTESEESDTGGPEADDGGPEEGGPEAFEWGLGQLRKDDSVPAESGHRSVSGGELSAELPSDDHDLARAVTSAHHSEPHGISSAPDEGEGCCPRVPATPNPSPSVETLNE